MTATPEPTADSQPAPSRPASSPCSYLALALGIGSLFFVNALVVLAAIVLGIVGLCRNEPSRSSAGVGLGLAVLALLVAVAMA